MLDLMHDQFHWPHMLAQAKEHTDKCCPCLTFKAKQPKALLENIVATHPLELVHLDYLCLEPGKDLEDNVLVVTDHFTQYTKPMSHNPRQLPKPPGTIPLSTMGCLKRSSQIGVEILSQLVAALCKLMETQKLQTSPYHPRLMASVRGLIPP